MKLEETNVCVHMPFYWRDSQQEERSRNAEERVQQIGKNIKEFLGRWNVKHIDLFVYSNTDKAKILDQFQSQKVTIMYKLYDLSNEDPRLLVWKCRPVMASQKDLYDIFIYIEDDIGIPSETLQYWWEWKDILHTKQKDVGFLLVETLNQKDFYSSNVLSPSAYLPFSEKNQSFVHIPMRYSAGWIVDKQEMKMFLRSVYWDFHCYYPHGPSKWSPHLCESSGIGYKLSYPDCAFPTEGGKISPKCFFYHLSNTYIQKEGTRLGKLRVEHITSNLA